jgi:nucleoside-diphosphate-sugar epimerase
MADLQQSTRAYDLAIENIYSQTKRNMARLVGADNTVSKKQLAEAVAERSGFEAKDLYILMSKCEDIIAGEPTNARETMNLISQLRALEEKLGFNRTRSSGTRPAGKK